MENNKIKEIMKKRETKPKIRGKKIYKYIKILAQGEFTAQEIAFLIDSDPYTTRAWLRYLKDKYNLVNEKENDLGIFYSLNFDSLKNIDPVFYEKLRGEISAE